MSIPFEKLAKLITLETGREKIAPGTLWEEIFTDSLEFLSFIQAAESLGKITDEAIANSSTVGELADAIIPAN